MESCSRNLIGSPVHVAWNSCSSLCDFRRPPLNPYHTHTFNLDYSFCTVHLFGRLFLCLQLLRFVSKEDCAKESMWIQGTSFGTSSTGSSRHDTIRPTNHANPCLCRAVLMRNGLLESAMTDDDWIHRSTALAMGNHIQRYMAIAADTDCVGKAWWDRAFLATPDELWSIWSPASTRDVTILPTPHDLMLLRGHV